MRRRRIIVGISIPRLLGLPRRTTIRAILRLRRGCSRSHWWRWWRRWRLPRRQTIAISFAARPGGWLLRVRHGRCKRARGSRGGYLSVMVIVLSRCHGWCAPLPRRTRVNGRRLRGWRGVLWVGRLVGRVLRLWLLRWRWVGRLTIRIRIVAVTVTVAIRGCMTMQGAGGRRHDQDRRRRQRWRCIAVTAFASFASFTSFAVFAAACRVGPNIGRDGARHPWGGCSRSVIGGGVVPAIAALLTAIAILALTAAAAATRRSFIGRRIQPRGATRRHGAPLEPLQRICHVSPTIGTLGTTMAASIAVVQQVRRCPGWRRWRLDWLRRVIDWRGGVHLG